MLVGFGGQEYSTYYSLLGNISYLEAVGNEDKGLTIRECHQIASQLEDQIENALHHLGRVTVILKPAK